MPGRDITCSLVGHLSGVLLLGRVDMAQYMFGAMFGPKDRKPHRHINTGGKFPRNRQKRFISWKYITIINLPGFLSPGRVDTT